MSALRGVQPVDEEVQEVRMEDQVKINEFSRNNARLQDMREDIKSKREVLENLSDASDEIALAEEDGIKFSLGDAFVDVDEETAEEFVEKATKELEAAIELMQGDIDAVESRQKTLKSDLYARFGGAINLEK